MSPDPQFGFIIKGELLCNQLIIFLVTGPRIIIDIKSCSFCDLRKGLIYSIYRHEWCLVKTGTGCQNLNGFKSLIDL